MKELFDIITSCGTFVALVALLYQIIKDRKDKIWDQAANITCWFDSAELDKETGDLLGKVIISNQSKHPIYNVVVSIDLFCGSKTEIKTGNDDCTYLKIVSPGNFYCWVKYDGGEMNKQFNASLSFSDSIGFNWFRDANGHLKRIKESSIEFRRLNSPYELNRVFQIKENNN